MPVIISPGQLARFSEFYHQLGAMQAAGLSLIQALNQLRAAPPSRSFIRPIQRLLDALNRGFTFTEALTTLGRWLPSFDGALLAAGEQSGRIDATCNLLAGYYENRAALARQVISSLLYPAVILHAAVLLAPFPQLFLTGDLLSYARQTLVLLVPLYTIVGLAILLGQGRHGQAWRSMIERLLHPLPVLGTARRSLALARLSVALDALITAGVPMVDAWALAAAASGSPALKREIDGWRSRLLAGDSPGDLLARARRFPALFSNLYRTGEVSGTLDGTLKRLRLYYEEEAQRKMKALAQWVPFALYLLIVIMLAVRIIGFWLNYYAGILDAV